MNNISKLTTSREDGNHHFGRVVTEGESEDMDHDNNTSSKKKSKKDKKRKHQRDEDSPSSLLLNGSKNGLNGSEKKKSKKNKDRREEDRLDDTTVSSTVDPRQQQLIVTSKQTLSPPLESEITRPRTAAATSTVRPMFASLASTSTTHASASSIASKRQLLLKKSPCKLKTIQGTVALLPSSLPDVSSIIKSRLNALLLMYDSNMGGVLLSLEGDVRLLPVDHSNPSTNNSRVSSNNNNNNNSNSSMLIGGRIINDLPYIHYRFEVNGLVFCPTVGMKLKGQVVECTPTFITLTTHHILSTKISTEKLHEQGFFYNSVSMEWMRERSGGETTATTARNSTSSVGGGGGGGTTTVEDEINLGRQSPSTSIYLDDIVEFVVDRIHECGGYISLDGTRPSVSTG